MKLHRILLCFFYPKPNKFQKLSPVFTICFSHLQKKNDYGTLIQIQDKTNSKWITLAFYLENKNEVDENSISLVWLRIGSRSERLGALGNIVLPKWFFSCLKINTVQGTVSFQTNNVVIATDVFIGSLKNFAQTPDVFSTNLRVGQIVYISALSLYRSYIGNINVFDETVDIASINCTTGGNYISWNPINWSLNPRNRTQQIFKNVSKQNACGEETGFMLAVSAQTTYGKICVKIV